MPRKRAILIASLVLVALAAGTARFVSSQRWAAERVERESTFIMIHFIAAEAAAEDGDAPKDFESLMRLHGGKDSVLRAFPEGLVYKGDGESFTLEEPRPRRISLFKKDRLIATNRKWPRWESSGEYARKFPEQEVPQWGDE